MIWAVATARDAQASDGVWALEALRLVSTPCIALDGRGRLIFANVAADALLAQRDGVWRQGETLAVSSLAARRRIDDLLQHRDIPCVAGCALGSGGGEFLIDRPSGRAPLVASACALTGARGRDHDDEARLALFLLDIERRPDLTRLLRRARALFDLTAAETCVLDGLLREQSVAAIAAARRVKVETVRTQVKALLRKTQSHRQSGLHRLKVLLDDGVDLPPLMQLCAVDAVAPILTDK
jgi:DNA-binding CsgD family transcriptional regulator